MPLPISRNQLDKLGDRLRDADSPADQDLDLLEAVLSTYDVALQAVRQCLRDMGYEPTVRLKTTGTLVDKLRRFRGSSLKTVQDLAGARVVVPGRLVDQNDARDRIFDAFTLPGHTPDVDDRRAEPRSGYRAVHVIVKIDGVPVEIQIRTELQDLWAQTFERLGDTWGRAIRYGGEPDGVAGSPEVLDVRREVVAHLIAASGHIAYFEDTCTQLETWPMAQDRLNVDEAEPHLRDSVETTNQVIGILLDFEKTLKTLFATMGETLDREVTRR